MTADVVAYRIRDAYPYCACYCEENIWKLCDKFRTDWPTEFAQLFVVFISNDAKLIPLWHQRAGKPETGGFVVWDYHVIAVLKCKSPPCSAAAQSVVLDLDTTLSFPCPVEEYFVQGIRQEADFLPSYHRKFRVLSAIDYLTYFASDRSHMRHSDGSWLKEPPAWNPIKTANSTHNIEEFWSMREPTAGQATSSVQALSVVYDWTGFRDLFVQTQ